MKTALPPSTPLAARPSHRTRVAIVAADPLRSAGLSALFEAHDEFELLPLGTSDVLRDSHIHLALLGSQAGSGVYELLATLLAGRPGLRVIVMGSGGGDETILKAIAAGAKGYLDDAATPEEVIQALQVVDKGSVWAPRRVLSLFIERATAVTSAQPAASAVHFTLRERDVLELLVSGRSNREIAEALQIELRTVKAHVERLMRKTGVSNRTALSIHAITNALLLRDDAN
jgi:DNA-binding NarL/FixJ family response regulator